ncbi:hypothetical protein [Ekhidna sp.]|jgi:hypothetical protein|uniref:hypothetical protein n=1 Tax=Ekhidna sp. TaxID=2608089 RepID=UPI0032EEF882
MAIIIIRKKQMEAFNQVAEANHHAQVNHTRAIQQSNLVAVISTVVFVLLFIALFIKLKRA